MPPTSRLRLVVAFTFLVLAALPVVADWDLGDGHKMHFPQLPDRNGWDVAATLPTTKVADDWQCSQTGPVTDIHIWGSWIFDIVVPIQGFRLEIWSDQPADPPNYPYSYPLTLLWAMDFPAGSWIEREWDMGDQGWFDPYYQIVMPPPNHQQIWQYNFFIDPAVAFVQQGGTIYWLVVTVDLGLQPVPGEPPNWGWKTSLDAFNDDSVWGFPPPGARSAPWIELFDPITGTSLHQAFVINGPGPDLFDWGDAPDPTYPTLAANSGANHLIGGNYFMGASIDPEPDGQPDAAATGDDNDGNDDEDGVTFTTPLFNGATAQVDVVTTSGGLLDAWIDYNGNGTWDHPAEHLWAGTSVAVASGLNSLTYPVPAGAVVGQTFARFRLSTAGSLPPTGSASDGEVEDYGVVIEEEVLLDFGDAPDQPYPTLLASNGARHIIDGATFMGGPPDSEPNGQPNGNATGDDINNVMDEDGVIFLSPLIPGFSAQVDVLASAPGLLDAWVDFDGNGNWADPWDQIFISVPLVPGPNNLTFLVPPGLSAAGTFARFRFSVAGGQAPAGLAQSGEVEDYEILIEDPIYDWGDAPDQPYPTLSASSGAVHMLTETAYLGSAPADGEADGQPDPTAAGDDLIDGNDDEEGVRHIPDSLEPTGTVAVLVTASIAGFLNGWVDFDANGSWLDSGEQVFTNQPLVAGLNILSFVAPAGSVTPTFTRYRFDTGGGGLGITGPANDGEVEDHYLRVREIFSDGFESGDTTAWSVTIGGP